MAGDVLSVQTALLDVRQMGEADRLTIADGTPVTTFYPQLGINGSVAAADPVDDSVRNAGAGSLEKLLRG
jgi:hypothetical protein